MRKGQVQFNWIFILVAGAILLAFFAGFIVKYTQLQDDKLNVQVGMGLDEIISNLRGTTLYKNLSTEVPFNVNFGCDGFSIGEYQQDIGTKVVFASKNISSDNVFTWTREWRGPFRIDNMIYFVNGDSKYYLSNDPLNLLQDMSGHIRENFVGMNNADIFVVFSLTDFNHFKQRGNTVYIEPREIGEVRFYREGREERSYHLGKEFIYGAIFSANYDNYYCNVLKLEEKYDNLRQIYAKKAMYLDSIYPECDYSTVVSDLNIVFDSNKFDVVSNNLASANSILWEKGCEVVF